MKCSLKKLVLFCLTVCAYSALPAASHADVILTYGTLEGGTRYIDLLPDTPGQTVQIFASGIGAMGGANGFELDLQIGDGGTDLGGTDSAPTITSIDLVTGTVWEGNSPVQTDVVAFPLARQSTIDTGSIVNDDGLVGTFTIDTSGITQDELDFRISGVAGAFNSTFFRNSTELATVAPNGRLRISTVPEPSAVGLIGLLGCMTALRRRR